VQSVAERAECDSVCIVLQCVAVHSHGQCVNGVPMYVCFRMLHVLLCV